MIAEENIKENSVPTYYAGGRSIHEATIIVVSCLIGVFFGGIHCIAWSFQLPTHLEQLLWRIASVTTAAVPFAVVLFIVSSTIDDTLEGSPGFGAVVCVVMMTFGMLAIIVGPIAYFVARLDLLVQAFVALRELPPLAYQNVKWTAFIPHI